MTITWYRHSHENRNDLLRFGLMRKHYSREIKYVEKSIDRLAEGGLGQKIANYPDLRHQSFLLVENGSRRVHCLVDSEDSFALISPLISEVDICFCAGYNADFFERKQFVQAYNWQTDKDLAWYRQTLEEKIEQLGQHFYKVKRFVPPTTNMCSPVMNTRLAQKWKNINHRFRKAMKMPESFADNYRGFEIRDAQLTELRHEPMKYDVVLRDSLWGWPQHRVNLHRQLQQLSKLDYRIHSSLAWSEPVICDDSINAGLIKQEFPITTGMLGHSYEKMLAQSRLAVFACGFHWGWRSVMMLALGTGIPVLTDRLLTEAYFDMNNFALVETESHDWETLKASLDTIDEITWQATKFQNQQVYDRYMSPDAVANYFLRTSTI